MIKVSIIVPVYSAAQYIQSCVESVMNQTYPFIECIFIDDCTPDNSIKLINEKLKDYDGKIEFRIISHKENLGAGAARNLGLREAKGDYIYFLDSDDIIYFHCIDSLVESVNEYPGVDMVMGDMASEDPVKNKVFSIECKDFPPYSEDTFWIHSNFLINIPVSPCNKLIRKDLIGIKHLYFPENIVNEDVLWVFFLSKHVRSIAFCKKKTYYYNYNDKSVTTALKNEEQHILSWMAVLDTYVKNINKNVKWIESFSLLKLFHHVRLYDVSSYSKNLLDRKIKERLKSQASNPDTPTVFKPMYMVLLCPVAFIEKIEFIWNKCLGIIYRLSKKQDRKSMSKFFLKINES